MPSFSVRVEGIRDPASPVARFRRVLSADSGGAALEETVEVRFPAAAPTAQNGFAFSTSFPFGFLEKSARVTLRRETIVYPAVDPQPGFDDLLLGIAGEIETYYRGLGRDFYRIRPYEALESARHVDWKATAHVGACRCGNSPASRNRPWSCSWTATSRPRWTPGSSTPSIAAPSWRGGFPPGRFHPFPLPRLCLCASPRKATSMPS